MIKIVVIPISFLLGFFALFQVAAGERGWAEKSDLKEESAIEEKGGIPRIIKPSITPREKKIETMEVEDVVAEEIETIQKYPPLDELLTVRMLTYYEPDDPEGYFVVVIEPKIGKSDFEIMPKDIILVVIPQAALFRKNWIGMSKVSKAVLNI